MPQTIQDRTIALAGIFQASCLVRDIAHRGNADANDVETCLGSLLKIDAASSAEIYGGVDKLQYGLRLVVEHLRKPQNMEITRYVVALLVLERKLSKQPKLMQRIRDGVESTIDKLGYFPLMHENIIASLAQVYGSTISALTPRVMVHGNPLYLTNPDNVNRIRALLLAGIRAAFLWRQSGGQRFTLLFKRKPLLMEAQRLLASIDDDGVSPVG